MEQFGDLSVIPNLTVPESPKLNYMSRDLHQLHLSVEEKGRHQQQGMEVL